MSSTTFAITGVRVSGLLVLAAGITAMVGLFALPFVIHLVFGGALSLFLLFLSGKGLRARLPLSLALLGLFWSLLLPLWGLAQNYLVVAALPWLPKALHILCGVGAMGVAEVIGARLLRAGAAVAAA